MNFSPITKWFIGIIICAICLSPASALAVTIPEKDGYIQDIAQILSSSEYVDIQEAIDKATFSLYVLTLDSVDGSSISTVASSTFSQWALGNEDVLLVISMAEQEVYLELSIGSTLDKSISQAAELHGSVNKITRFMDDYFVVHAADGSFAQGIISVIKQLDVWKGQMDTSINNPINSPSTTIIPETVPTPTKTSTPAPTIGTTPTSDSAEVSPISNTVVLVFFLLVIIVVVTCFQWYRRSSINKAKKAAKNGLDKAFGNINEIEQIIDPIVQFSKGESEQYLHAIKERFYTLLQASEEISNQIEAIVVPRWVTNSTIRGIQSIQQQTQSYVTAATEILNSLNEYQEMESHTTKRLEQSQIAWKAVDQQLHEQIKVLGYSLEELLSRSASIQASLARGREAIEFDPMRVEALLEHIPEQITQLTGDIELVSKQKLALQQLPERLQSNRIKLEQWIKDESLTLVEIKPFAFLDQVDGQMKELSHCIQVGNTNGAAVHLQGIEQLMDEAREQISNTIRARDWNKNAIEVVDQRLASYQDGSIHELERFMRAIEQTYHIEHWSDISGQIGEIKSSCDRINHLLAETVRYNELDSQRYYEAERNLQQILEHLVEMDTISQHISNRKTELDQSYEQQLQALKLVEHRYSACQSTMAQSGIQMDERLLELVRAADLSIARLNRLVGSIPRSVTKLAADIQMESTVIEQMEKAVYVTIEAKRAAEISLEQERARRRNMNHTWGGRGGGHGGSGISSGGSSLKSSGPQVRGSSRKSGNTHGGGSGFTPKSKGGGSSWGSGNSKGGGSKW